MTATWNNKFHVAAPQSKFQGCLTPDEAAYHRNASQGRLWGGLLGRGSGLWPAKAVRVVHHARERETDAVRVVLDQYGHGRADRSVSGGVQGPESELTEQTSTF